MFLNITVDTISQRNGCSHINNRLNNYNSFRASLIRLLLKSDGILEIFANKTNARVLCVLVC